VKVEHGHPTCLIQSFPIPYRKWEVVTIDFITKLNNITRKYDSIIIAVDKLTKATHFMLVKMTHNATNIAKIYRKEIVKLHEISKEIVSDKDTKFT
jgi:hypothetical protein